MEKTGITLQNLATKKKGEITKIIKEQDTRNWKDEQQINFKNLQEIQGNNKRRKWIDNTQDSTLMLRARTNSLKLNWRNRFTNNLECCPVCKQESEDLKHFLLLCPKYSTIRSQYEILQQPYNQVTEELIIQLLLIKQIEDSGQIEKKKRKKL